MSNATFDILDKFNSLNVIINLKKFGVYPADINSPPVKSTYILMDRLVELRINSTLGSGVPNGHIVVNDKSGELIDFIQDNNCFIDILITRWKDGFGPDSKTPVLDQNSQINHTFIVSKFDIMETNQTEDKIKINIVSINFFLLLQNVLFSSENETSKNTLEQLKKLFSNLKTETDLIVPTDLKTDKKVSYISTSNSTYTDAIEYLMDYGFELKDGIISYTYNLLKRTFMLWLYSQKDMDVFNSESTPHGKSIRFSAMIPSQIKAGQLEALLIDDIALKSNIPTEHLYEKTADLSELFFDYESGIWTGSSYTTDSILKKLSTDLTNTENTSELKLKPWNVTAYFGKIFNFKNNRTLTNGEEHLEKKIKSLFLENNYLVLRTNGWLSRTPGDPFTILANTGKETRKTINMLIGRWTVISVSHIFMKNLYKNEIILGRNERVKDPIFVEVVAGSGE